MLVVYKCIELILTPGDAVPFIATRINCRYGGLGLSIPDLSLFNIKSLKRIHVLYNKFDWTFFHIMIPIQAGTWGSKNSPEGP